MPVAGCLSLSDNYIIEIKPKSVGRTVQAGIVVRDGSGFRFFAATHAFNALEGQFFDSPKAAEHAALRRIAYRDSAEALTKAIPRQLRT
jgi:hypothetical protein